MGHYFLSSPRICCKSGMGGNKLSLSSLTLRLLMSYICIYIYDISSLMVNDLTLILLTWRKW